MPSNATEVAAVAAEVLRLDNDAYSAIRGKTAEVILARAVQEMAKRLEAGGCNRCYQITDMELDAVRYGAITPIAREAFTVAAIAVMGCPFGDTEEWRRLNAAAQSAYRTLLAAERAEEGGAS